MAILTKQGGVWKESEPRVRDAGVWKEAKEGYVKDEGVWKEAYKNGITRVWNVTASTSTIKVVICYSTQVAAGQGYVYGAWEKGISSADVGISPSYDTIKHYYVGSQRSSGACSPTFPTGSSGVHLWAAARLSYDMYVLSFLSPVDLRQYQLFLNNSLVDWSKWQIKWSPSSHQFHMIIGNGVGKPLPSPMFNWFSSNQLTITLIGGEPVSTPYSYISAIDINFVSPGGNTACPN